VTIIGTNDAPIITSSEQAGTVVEDSIVAAEVTVGGRVTSSDVDEGSSAVYTTTDTAAHGTFTLTKGGDWTYTLDSAGDAVVQALNVGQSLVETFTVTVTDDNNATATQDVTVTIIGTNDAPIITSSEQAGTVVEDSIVAAEVTVGGRVTSSDVDEGSSAVYTTTDTAAHGTFTLTKGGDWTYTLDSAGDAVVQALNVGQSLVETFTVTVTDDNNATATQDVTVTINGTNDAPVAEDDSFTVDEGLSVKGNVIRHEDDNDGFSDTDGGDGNTLSVTKVNGIPFSGDAIFTMIDGVLEEVAVSPLDDAVFIGTNDNGILRINENGAFTYENKGFFKADDSIQPSFEYTLSDGIDTDTATVSINITVDAPVANDDTNFITFGLDSDGKVVSHNGIEVGNILKRASSGDTSDSEGAELTQIIYADEVYNFDDLITSIGIVTDYGLLTVHNNGDYSFVINEDDYETVLPINNDALKFGYTIQDGDALNPETAEGVLTITVKISEVEPLKAPEPSAKFIELDLDETDGSIDTFSHTQSKTGFDEGPYAFIQDMQLDLSDVLIQTHSNNLDKYLEPDADGQKVTLNLDLETNKGAPMEQELVLEKAGSESEEGAGVYVTNGLLAQGGVIISDAFAANPAPLPEFDTQDVL
jgi:VCBS repeat-containing protein